MRSSSTISSKGQITVPLEIRRHLGLKTGDRLEFITEDDRTIIRPARLETNPFEEYIGILPAFGSKHEINKWVAEMRDDDQER